MCPMGDKWSASKTEGLRVGFLGQALWCKPIILVALHSEAGGCQGQGLPVLQIEFMACLDNLAKPCLKIQKLGGVCGYSSRPWAPMPKTYFFFKVDSLEPDGTNSNPSISTC